MSAWMLALIVAQAPQCPTSTIRLDWVRSPDAVVCPSGDAVAERIVERLGCSPFGPTPTARFEVTIEAGDPGWRARVARFETDGGADNLTAVRELDTEAERCDVLGEAVALTLALVAERLPRIDLIDTASTSAAAPTAVTASFAPPGPRLARAPLIPTSTAVRTVTEGPPRGTFEVEGVVDIGTLPQVAFGARLSTSLLVSSRFELGVGALVLPVRRTSLFFFGLVAADLHGCVRFVPRGGFELGGCARLYGGTLLGFTQTEAKPIEPGAYPWLGAAAGGTFTARLTGPISVRVGAEALFSLVDRVLLVDPTREVALDESPVAFLGTAGLVVRFR